VDTLMIGWLFVFRYAVVDAAAEEDEEEDEGEGRSYCEWQVIRIGWW